MIVYFADRQMRILGQASTGLPEGLLVKDDLKEEDVDTGVATFECRIPYDRFSQAKVRDCAKAGNYLLRSNAEDNEFYTIIEVENDSKKQEVYLYAEDAGMDLLNEICGAYQADKAYNIAHYINKYAKDTGFEIGINEIPGTTRKLSWDGETTCAARIASVATQFGVEISYSFDIKGMEVTHKYINIFKERGKDIGIQLRLNRDIDRIITKSSVENLCTSLQCTGGIPEGEDTAITLKGYEYDDGDFYISGSRLVSREALKKWSRYVWEKEPNQLPGYTGHIVGTFSYDTTSQSELCNRAVSKLKQLCDIETNYEVDIRKLPDNTGVGDRVDIIDDADELYLSARILKLAVSVCNQKYMATLGEYLIKDSGISQKVEDLAAQFSALAKSRTFYTWVAYADDKNGTNISLDPAGKSYIGFAANQMAEEVDLSDPSVYTWSLIQGEEGVGVEAVDTQYYKSSSGTELAGGTWADEDPGQESGYYIWQKTITSYTNDTKQETRPVCVTLNIQNLLVDYLKSETADIKYAMITDLNAVSAKVSDLEASTVKAAYLEANYAKVSDLEATYIKASTAEAEYARLDKANITDGWITTAMIETGAIGTAQIADGSITDAKIVGLTANKITAGILDAGTIEVINLNAANITVGTINGQQIASGAIDVSKLNDALSGTINTASTNASKALVDAESAQTTADGKNTVFYQATAPSTTGRKVNDIWFDTGNGNRMYCWNGSAWTLRQFGTDAIAELAITNALIADATIQSAKIANLDAAKITTGTLDAARIGAEAITSDKLAANAVTAGKIAVNAVTAGTIASSAVTTDKLAASAITAEKIASNAVTADKIVSNAITADKLAANSITTEKIAANAVTAAKISVDDLSALSATIGGFTIGSAAIYSKENAFATTADNIYIGSSGISLGTTFKVTKDGALTAQNAVIEGDIHATGFQINCGGDTFSGKKSVYASTGTSGISFIHNQDAESVDGADYFKQSELELSGDTLTIGAYDKAVVDNSRTVTNSYSKMLIDPSGITITRSDDSYELFSKLAEIDTHTHNRLYNTDGVGNVVIVKDGDYYYFRPYAASKVICGSANNPWYNIYTERLNVTESRITCLPSYENTVSYATNMYVSTAGVYSRTTNTSSRMIKHDIKNLEDHSISAERLYEINVRQFKYNEGVITDKNDSRYGQDLPGFIIEELAAVYPIAVDKPSQDVKEWSWNAQYLIPPMLKLVQEQHRRETELESQIRELQRGIGLAMSEIARLRAMTFEKA